MQNSCNSIYFGGIETFWFGGIETFSPQIFYLKNDKVDMFYSFSTINKL